MTQSELLTESIERSGAPQLPVAAPVRVLFVDHTAALGGGEIALLNLVRTIDQSKFQPVVLLFSTGPLADQLKRHGIETHILPLTKKITDTRKGTLGPGALMRLGDMGRLLLFVYQVSRFIRSGKFELVHTNSLKADVIGGIAGRVARSTVVWHVRDRIADDYLPSMAAHVFKILCRYVPHFVIANSWATWRTLEMGIDSKGVAVPSGVVLSRRENVVHDGTPVNESNTTVTGEGVCIGLVGRLSPWKGQHIFIKAASAVREKFPDARFQIIGGALFNEQAYEQEIRQLTHDLDLDDAIEFTGFRNDVRDLIGKLDMVVHASTTGEPFGQVVIEGMAAGKAVVATDGGGIPEIVIDGETGLLVPMNDVNAMAEAICQLLRAPDRARAMGVSGRKRVAEFFTIERTARAVEGIYDRLLKKKQA